MNRRALGRASSPLRADDCNHDFLKRKARRAQSDAPYPAQAVHGTDARPTLEVEALHEPQRAAGILPAEKPGSADETSAARLLGRVDPWHGG
jgi:hypothetical protein